MRLSFPRRNPVIAPRRRQRQWLRRIGSITLLGAVLFTLVVAVLGVSGCCVPRHPIRSVKLLAGVVRQQDTKKSDADAVPARAEIAWTIQGRPYRGDLYRPARARAGILFIPGAAEAGRDHPSVIAFARALQRAGFAVLIPDLANVRELRLNALDVRQIADAFGFLVSRPDLAPRGRAGMAAPSYAVGPTVLAALEPEIRNDVRFILGIGGYYDLREVITYFTTGYYREGGRWRYQEPNEYGKWVFALSNASRLSDPADREGLRRIAQSKLDNPEASIEPLAAGLNGEGRDVLALLTNTDPERVPELIERLPAAVGADIDALDLARRDLSALRARLILVHGYDDALIPYPQSTRLAQAAPAGASRVFLVHGLAHVEIGRLSPVDAWKLLCAVDALLREQDRR